jgi:hypothetical protein
MGKNKKKRNKKYTGIDAKPDDSVVTVHKVSAVNRSRLGQWLFEHKKLVKVVGVVVAVVAIVVLAFVVTL